MQTYKEQKAFVARLDVIDDVFFQKMAEDLVSCGGDIKNCPSKTEINRVIQKTGTVIENITHEIYVNTSCG